MASRPIGNADEQEHRLVVYVLCVVVLTDSQAFCHQDLQWFNLFVKNIMFMVCANKVEGVNKCTVPNHKINLNVSAEIKETC